MNPKFNNFIDFLQKNQVFGITVATLLSGRISELSSSIAEHLLAPLLDVDIDNDGISDRVELENKTLTIRGKKIQIGKVYVAILKFIVLTYITYLLVIIIKNVYPNSLL